MILLINYIYIYIENVLNNVNDGFILMIYIIIIHDSTAAKTNKYNYPLSLFILINNLTKIN